jgi:ABC-type glycerol-3-phosphate transport system substrate-binding protein
VVLLSGCAIRELTPTEKSSKTNGNDTEPSKVITLTLWQHAATKSQIYTDIENEFLAANPHIKFNIVEQPDMGTSAYLAAIASGNAPSVFAAGYPTTMSYIYQNAIYPIDEFIAETPDFANFDQSQVDTFLVNGKHYGVPTNKYVMGFMYNKKLFAEAGISAPPTTWDEFYSVCEKLTIPEKQQYGFGLNGAQWASWHFEQWVWGAGGNLSVLNPDGTVSLTFDDPAVKVAADFYRKLKDNKLIQPDANMQISGLLKDFAMGKSGMIVSGLQTYEFFNIVGMGGEADNIGFFSNPAGPSGEAYAQMGGDVFFITTTKDKDVARASWDWLMYSFSRESLDRIYKFRASKGAIGAEIFPRTDLNIADYGEVNTELQAVLDYSTTIGRSEYPAKGAVGSIADDAIARWFINPSLNVEDVMLEAQKKANSNELIEYNEAILAGK